MLSRSQQAEARFARDDLGFFIEQAWSVCEPATPYVRGRHIDEICRHLEAVTNGQIRNLLINIPPRHAKSLTVSVFWPVWEWIRFPHRRWLFSSYAATLSTRDSLKCRRLIDSPWFQERWGDKFQLCSDQNVKNRFDNNKAGYRLATSVGGSATGEGGDRVVVDDPHAAQDVHSDQMRETALIWWDETMSTRLNDPKTGAKIIVMQRLHEKDLSGHVLAQGGYTHLSLPAEYEPDNRCVTTIGGDWRSERGELLWPDRIGDSEIADFKVRLGPIGYAGQFQQQPSPAGGSRFKQSYFRHWQDHGEFYKLIGGGAEKVIVKNDCWIFAACDPAGVDKAQNDKACYTVLHVWAVNLQADMILLHEYREQSDTPATVNAIADVCRRFGTLFVAVEKNGIGLGIVQNLYLTGINVMPVTATTNKEARSETAEIRMAAGKVYFRQDATYLFDLESELMRFPNGEFCDRVDALAWATIVVQQRHGAPTSEQPNAGSCLPPSTGQFRRTF